MTSATATSLATQTFRVWLNATPTGSPLRAQMGV